MSESLRNLVFDVAFNGQESPLLAMNNATEELKSNALEAGSAIDGMESATDDLGKTSSGVGKVLEENWKKITIATGLAGTAIEAMARKQAGMTEQTKRLSASTGISADAMRQLAVETSNVTFPLNDVLDLFEVGRQQGIKSAEQLQEYALFWDLVGDATKESATKLAESSAGLRAVGISAGEEKQALAAFGYITENTTSTVSELLQFLERTGPQLREMGMNIDDAAAIMGLLEHEMGMTSRIARQEFTSAVAQSDGNITTLLDTLGIATDKFNEYQSAVASSSDIIQRNADIHGESYTTMQKLQHKISELNYQYGPLIELTSMLTPVLLGLGPAIKVVSAAKALWAKINFGALVPSIKATTIAMLASPLTWIVLGIMAVIAAAVLLWKNWDKVKEKLVGVWTAIKDAWNAAVDFLKGINLFEIGTNIIQGLIGGIASMGKAVVDAAKGIASKIGDSIKGFFGINSPSRLMMDYGVNIGEGLEIGISDKVPDIEHTTKQLNEATTRPLSGAVTNNASSFAPKINVYVQGGGSARETAKEFEKVFDQLMAKYERKLAIRNPVIMEG